MKQKNKRNENRKEHLKQKNKRNENRKEVTNKRTNEPKIEKNK